MSINSRRSFLKAAGVLSALHSRLTHAAAAPPRLVIVYMPNCNQHSFWLPTGGRTPQTNQGDATAFTLGAGYKPLERVRQHLTLVEGIGMNVSGDAHSAGVIRFTTGGGHTGGNAGTPTGEWARQPSIDQLLVTRSPRVQGTRVPSLDLIADDRQESMNPVYVVLSWGTDAKPRAPELAPTQVYDRLFAGLPVANNEAGRQRLVDRENSVLAFLKDDLARLQAQIPTSRRGELDGHLQGLRELERTVLGAVKGATGALPVRPDKLDARASTNHPKVIDAHFALIRSALELDLTRVVTFSYGSSNSFVDFSQILGGRQFLDNITYPFAKFGVHALAHRDENKRSDTLLTITQWYAEKTAQLVQALADTPDSDGTRLLDNTIVVLFSECGDGHGHDNIPIALFGGRQLGLTGNRCLRYKGRSANDLWTALAPRFGLDLAVFGDKDQNQGPLPGLFG